MDLEDRYHLTSYSCRGFNSLSGAYETRARFKKYLDGGQIPIGLYFGDCDPSGDIIVNGDCGTVYRLLRGVVGPEADVG